MIVQSNTRTATTLRLLCEIAEEMGIGTAACLENTGVDPSNLTEPSALFAAEQEVQAIENFVRLAPKDAGLGTKFARRMHVHAFGIWGFAILTSPTLRAAVETAVEYAKLSSILSDLAMDENDGLAFLEFGMSGLPETIHRFILERHSTVGMTFISELLQDPEFEGFELWTTDADTSYARELSAVMQIPVMSSSTRNALAFPAESLSTTLPKSDPVTLNYCLDQCKMLLEQIGGTLPPWSQKVRDAVVDGIGMEQKIEDIAERLAVTERTLRRRLTEEGTSFRHLYTDVRMMLANELLESAGLNVETVAWRVGYSETASFVRAFSKKFGTTPGEVRRKDSSKINA